MTGFKLENLLIENQKNPIGLDCENPRISWELCSEKKDVFQTAYQIVIIDKSGMKAADTGRISDDTNTLVVVPGVRLEPMKAYCVQVSAWNNYEEKAEIQEEFETGRMGLPWAASWIEPEQIPTVDSAEGKIMNRETLFNDPHKGSDRDYSEFQPDRKSVV